ncbi:scavenger receptor cysteine-rich type 1 protein M130 [Patella vulgata]|uniref:scavenger receptor cysteine-rich type 1 protein M130 n=1 Tax=Patella vulgata TaxID=6465 RepID=UPI0024A91659|nr:scavenger receptor cysteine-rich type 1 protein M130 [Patella vulgata]
MTIRWHWWTILIFNLISLIYSLQSLDANSVRVDSDGSVKVKVNGVEGRICATDWDDRDAEVLCQGLGWSNSAAYNSSGDSNIPTLATGFDCQGSEARLEDCSYSVVGDNGSTCRPYSSTYNSAFAYCYNQSSEVIFSLEHGNYGRVLVTKDGYERYLCLDGYFSYSSGDVLCRGMGYRSGRDYPYSDELQITAVTAWWKNTFNCGGSEPSYSACIRSTWESRTGPVSSSDQCVYNTPSAFCYGTARLHTPYRNSSGVLGIYHAEQYRGVCADGFDQNAINVVCNSLGFQGGQLGRDSYYNGSPYGIRISNVSCTGTEKSFDQCTYQYSENQINSCSEKVVLSCLDPNDPDSSLPDGSIKLDDMDRVLIKQYGMWGTICYDGWNDVNAELACKQLGYDKGSSLKIQLDNYKPRFYKNMNCNGSATSLDECSKEIVTGYCYYTFDSGAYCYNASSSAPSFSLIDGNSTNAGKVQITIEGETRYLCDTSGYFNYEESNLVCRNLGFKTGQEYKEIETHQFPYGAPFWSNNVNCQNRVDFVDACTTGPWIKETNNGQTTCNYKVPVVFCYGIARLHTPFRNSSGVLGIYHAEQYRGVCADGFDQNAINVVCNSLGFQGGQLGRDSYYNGSPYGMYISNVSCTGTEKSFDQCTYQYSENQVNSCSEKVVLSCFDPNDPDSSLPDGSIKFGQQNRILIKQYGTWGTICYDDWDDKDAEVACKQLGYDKGSALQIQLDNYKPRFYKNMNCSGSETSLDECNKEVVTGYCYYTFDAGAYCSNGIDANQYSLVHGDGIRYGRLMVTRENATGFVCSPNYSFDYTESNIMCRQFGFTEGERLNMPVLEPGYGTVFWETGIDCYSNEPSIDACLRTDWQKYNYQGPFDGNTCRYHIPSMFCYGQVRLHTKYLNTTGAVLVRHNQKWIAVCNDGFDDKAAQVVCGEMGFVSGMGQVLPNNSYDNSIVTSNWHPSVMAVRCLGHERSFNECSYTIDESRMNCSSTNFISVSCVPHTTTALPIPTTTPSYFYTSPSYSVPVASTNNTAWERSRIVSVKQNGMWGGVCSEGWDDVDALVFCKDFGYETGMALRIYRDDYRPLWFYNVRCTGSEASFMDCPHDMQDSENGTCRYSGRAAAFCYNQAELAQYRLTGASKPNMGRVEVFTQNKWALLCDLNGIYGDKANIICQTMGYKYGEPYYSNNLNNITGTYWRNSFSCEYGMRILDACENNGWTYQDGSTYSECSYSQPASVFCYGEVRLSTKYANSSGAVLVFDGDNNYRSLCAAQFNANTANVVCKQLGFPSGGRLLPGSSYHTYSIPSNISYSCTGTESRLSDCPVQSSVCPSNNSYASVACIDDNAAPISGNDGDAIVDSQGQVLVLYHGIWGTVCSLEWGDQDASVVCREAGHMYGKAYEKYDYEGNSRPVWIYGTDCSGSETKLKDCQLRNSDDDNSTCRYSASAMAYCYNDTNSVQYSLVGTGSNYGIVQVTRDASTNNTALMKNRRVTVKQNGMWGGICFEGWDDVDATVFCKELGYEAGNDGDAIVDSQGQVLVLYHGIWGTVCSSDWGDQDANVVCKEAGHIYVDGQYY